MRKAKVPQSKQVSTMKSKILFNNAVKRPSPTSGVRGLVDNVPVMQSQLPKRGLGKIGKVRSRDVVQTGPRVNMEASSYELDQFIPFENFEVLDKYDPSDPVEALNLKKLNRKQQMLQRR